MVAAAAAVLLEATTVGIELASERRLAGFFDHYFSAGVLAFAVVGAIVAARLPHNPIGWLFLAFGMFGPLSVATQVIATGAILDRSIGQALELATWLAAWTADWAPPGLIVLLMLLFPTGRLGRVERWIASVTLITFGLGALATALAPGRLETVALDNPFGVESAALALVRTSADLALTPLFGVAAATLLLRLRRAVGHERLQLKWFAYVCALTVGIVIANNVLYALAGGGGGVADAIGSIAFSLSLFAIPATVGIAMLRHDLYEIDVVINRTLVYVVLTACLALAYWLGVVSLGLLLRPLTSESDLAIAGSTLAVAALFRPLRGRIQATVDRRFYRRRYDAERTLESFSARLRDQVDLDALGVELEAVVSETMAPAHVSLWLRPRRPDDVHADRPPKLRARPADAAG